ncbi:MAG TPA: CHAD domain-containing protein [Acidimicrobiia bacterium]|nr:CHAD domain-containing protein [Acidimicrobiia bacterium]
MAQNQLRKAVEGLSGQAGLGPDEAAHDARKRTKKLRALLRLVRRELGDEVFRRENAALRDAARRLSPVRDAWVLVEALDDLATPSDDDLSPAAVAGLRAVLVREHRALREGQDEDDALARAAADYEQVLARASRWPVQDHGWDSLEAGMGKVVRDGRHRMTKACVKARAEDFHEWRKQVKYLRHQLDLLRPAWPDVIHAMAATADEIAELLGADHDLAVLRERVAAESVLAPGAHEALLERIEERRSDCQREAIALGRRLYAEKPSSLTNRLGRLWTVAA